MIINEYIQSLQQIKNYVDKKVISTSSPTYTHIQSSPAEVWTINHNLDKYPSVTVVTSAEDEVQGGVVNYLDTNTLTITFSSAFSGKAHLN